jgi:hypothetical protein
MNISSSQNMYGGKSLIAPGILRRIEKIKDKWQYQGNLTKKVVNLALNTITLYLKSKTLCIIKLE